MNKKLQVFKEEPGFFKLFQLFKQKYRSLGRVGGAVSVKTFTEVELESIAGFLGQSKERLQEKGSIALLDFEKELVHTGYADYTLLPLLEAVLQEKIFTKKEESEREQQQEDQFIDSLVKQIPDGRWWFEWIQAKSSDTRWIWSLYKQNKEEVFEKLLTVFRAFADLPKKGEFERLPFFSQRTTGNPHFFDTNEVGGKLLLHCMYVNQIKQGNTDAVIPRTVEELNDLLAEYGIMRDDLWNFVTCQGLLASTNNKVHPVWQAAINTHSVMNMPIKELTKVDRVWPAFGTKVWIVENSSVCSTIMDAVPTAPIVCTHGQLRVASWQLLDRLVQSNCTLYYSGDIDPEGIVIAEKLKKRYQDRVILWRMDQENYKGSLSNEDISSRLSKLDNLSSPDWNRLITMMREVKLAGYQEAIVSSLIRDIERNLI
ncbi:TIGR02679 family protein [Mesobacillus persicus]|uniref:TIGR02679 family protein n=1 Tax=Mesobacillus persicus TaxID=930146 RepID=A0A1H8APF0_9BACI|nr:TIGR02679 family protein [Mesobacillus persicus]SEM71659.1 TIGR02679 family protein [Mesobacillus persicus]